ncbi:Secernin-2 [Amphibalanus amphitrite]|uniref:Secernin-2 n=1 Tax=Amphibalanus amphitrite TaxID=1232801 RepID=A0A6A4VR09_AMPAM|nr:secernin-2-like [Amphibalanus amphitrite]XP_043210537.1 secernin-2-like [Amphibalanus amphitrite]XP_043236029.1 secernin-2-like [Amphibalanus amphitrite]XP_043236030.1 secernin-2-like [Amphibalanus amphitrite]KAF0296635.1 Secernin-2 [Amphibalanus amphitrite]
MADSLVSCDTFVALPPATNRGFIVFGKNSDRPQGEVQEVLHFPAATHEAGSKVQCTYIEIDQAASTHAVVLSRPAWMWGAEMGANEHGLCVGNEAVWTRLQSDDDKTEKLLGMDLVRLALERAATAREGCEVITALLAAHGQGGACSDTDTSLVYHNSFLLADRAEAWVLETAGHLWAAKRITAGVANISNCLTIDTEMDLQHPDLQSEAKSRGLWDGSGEFSFKKVFAMDGEWKGCSRLTEGRKLMEKLAADGKFDVESMLTVLRDEPSGICRPYDDAFHTAASQVSVLPPADSARPACHWFTGTPDPQRSVFKPFVFVDGARVSPHIQSPEIENDPAKTVPRFQRPVDRAHRLYRLHAAALRARPERHDEVRVLEQRCVPELDQFLEQYTADKAGELCDLFKDCIESELQFYK